MAKLTLTDISSGYASANAHNVNNAAIEAALENTLSRDGTAPNAMEADLDMDSNRILNLPAPSSASEPLRYADLPSGSAVTSAALTALADTESFYTGINVEAALEELAYQSKDKENTLQDLRDRQLTSHVPGDVVYVKAHTKPGDGGHGNFRYVTTGGPYIDNDGTIIVPTGGDGSEAWLRDYSGAANAQWFGAKSGGVTPVTAAINAALNSEAKTVFVPFGTYLLDGSISIPEGKALVGAGKWETLFVVEAASSFNMFLLGNYSSVSDMSADAAGSLTNSSSPFLLSGCHHASVDNVVSKNASAQGIALSDAYYCSVTNAYVSGSANRAVILDPYSHDNVITNLHTEDCESAAVLIGHGSYNNIVRGVIAKRINNAAIWIHEEAYSNVVSGFVCADPVTSVHTPAVLLSLNAYDNVISNGFVSDYGIGILLRGGPVDAGYNDGNTRANIISNIRGNGPGVADTNSAFIKIDSTDAGITIVDSNQITNCVASNYYYGMLDPIGDAAYRNLFRDIDLSTNITTPFSLAFVASQSKALNVGGFTPRGSLGLDNPAVPASGVAATNNFPFPVLIYVEGLPAGGNVSIDGGWVSAAGIAGGTFVLDTQQTITLSYGSGTPAWQWFGM